MMLFYLICYLSTLQAVFCLSGKALIVQNKGGGHGTIGYQLCKTLKQQHPGLQLVILQDKCNYKKPPFSSYKELESSGVQVIETSLSNPGDLTELRGMNIDYVIDNWSKNSANATFVCDIAKNTKAQQYVFISSAGMYKNSNLAPLIETDPVKENDARKVEITVSASGIPYTFLRPQYIYGPKSSKRYLDFFIGRAYRKLITPLPLHGDQLVCLTHIEDVSTLISATLGKDVAKGQIFNCGTDKSISYKGLAKIIHTALGNDASDMRFMYYEPKDFDKWDGSGVQEFPFRRETFITSPSKAKMLLGWTPRHRIEDHIAADIKEYEELGGFKEKWGVEEVKYDLEVIASKDSSFSFTYPFFDDDTNINKEKRPYPFESS
jgi:nucleoside-diphosphate-sugar epimerase